MAYRIVVTKPVSQLIGSWRLDRKLLILLLSRLHDDLANRGDALRGNRLPEDAEHLVEYEFQIRVGDHRHRFYLSVNDVQATGYLFVVDARHESDPAG